jgi:GNAT superfamily N-acetyltransferase
MCVRDAVPGAARLRPLLVEPDARGPRIGDRLVAAVADFAREAGYRELVLRTNFRSAWMRWAGTGGWAFPARRTVE